ncbi:MAG: DNA alkylation repair protein [Synergistaceae bacterium]|nr:DNA alkylation repair protein [Synergistaceae bacterium]
MDNLASYVIEKLSEMANPGAPKDEELSLFGIQKLRFLDVPHDRLVALAEEIGMPRHELAVELWDNDAYESKLLSCMFSEPSKITIDRADDLADGLDSWIVCEYCCYKVLWKLPFAARKALEWANSRNDVVSCVGFSLISALAANLAPDSTFEPGFFDSALFYTRKGASNVDMNVRRAVGSAISRIGRRSRSWHEAAVETAEEIAAQPNESARWVSSQSLAELKSTKVTSKFKGD